MRRHAPLPALAAAATAVLSLVIVAAAGAPAAGGDLPPVSDPQPPSTLLSPGTTSVELSVTTSQPTSCSWALGDARPLAEMTPFTEGEGALRHRTRITGLDPDPLRVNEVHVRCASAPDYLLTVRYRSVGTVDPAYPRTGNLWGWWTVLPKETAARIDLWLGADFAPDAVLELRRLNPDVLILTSINAVEHGGLSEEYYLHDVNGRRIEVWPGSYRLNLTRNEVADYQADYAYRRVLDDGLMVDGVFFDNVMTTQSWLTRDIYGEPVAIDADEDGVADDPAVLDAAWKAGVFREIRTFRRLMPGAIVSGHAMDIDEPGIAELFNGISIGFRTADVLEGEAGFLDVLGLYDAWLDRALPPSITMVESSPIDQIAYGYDYAPWSNAPAAVQEFARTHYPWMRFGLAFTLMNDGYFAHEWGDTWHGNDWWYDELDFDLGRPLAPHTRVDLGADPGPNRIVNGGFEDPLGPPWSFWANGDAGCVATVGRDTTTAAVGAASARIDIAATSGTDWHVELAQRDRTLVAGERYDVSFRARSDRPRGITVGSTQGVPPWHWYGLWRRVAITSEWTSYTVSFEATASAADARIQFEVGEVTGTVWIDDVSMTIHPPEVLRRDFTNGVVLLNGTATPQRLALGPGYHRLDGAQAPRLQVVLDDGEAGFSFTGPWTTDTFDSGEWQASGPFYHDWRDGVHVLTGASGEARWALPVDEDDTYSVYAWWPAAPAAGAWNPAATFQVWAGEVPRAAATFDQRTGGDAFHLVGELRLAPRDAPTVRLLCPGGAACIADAIYLVSGGRYNDGSPAGDVTLAPFDGIVLRRDTPIAALVADAGADVTLVPEQAVRLGSNPTAAGGTPPYSYSWRPVDGLDDPTAANPTARPTRDTVYTLTVTDSMGFTATDSVTVTLAPRHRRRRPAG